MIGFYIIIESILDWAILRKELNKWKTKYSGRTPIPANTIIEYPNVVYYHIESNYITNDTLESLERDGWLKDNKNDDVVFITVEEFLDIYNRE